MLAVAVGTSGLGSVEFTPRALGLAATTSCFFVVGRATFVAASYLAVDKMGVEAPKINNLYYFESLASVGLLLVFADTHVSYPLLLATGVGLLVASSIGSANTTSGAET